MPIQFVRNFLLPGEYTSLNILFSFEVVLTLQQHKVKDSTII